MNVIEQTHHLISKDEFRMACLKAARTLALPQWFLAAGFLRNAIWDHQHHKEQMTPLNDIDLVYFDTQDLSHATELAYQEQLIRLLPHVNWEVRNQARMHLNHGHLPYHNTEHAISQWVEIPTCVGVSLGYDDQLVFCAPFGLDANWSLNVAINPNSPQPNVFTQRIAKKHWLTIWPKLVLVSNV
ncbi:nucleotidyltransferase family protein [Vibrio ziniensis]|uniref:Nucleotidyltransferase family protein n=1 Tax=Vibrio ziniensis TaxID=2711221 RepID=A0A6G7CNU4_9VIBR|nr:nucleotidyltransferase family protein [Vibrio ziniensis]QIH43811.1 nucleotidyltransferase family protein [Vibrio ziniensis]